MTSESYPPRPHASTLPAALEALDDAGRDILLDLALTARRADHLAVQRAGFLLGVAAEDPQTLEWTGVRAYLHACQALLASVRAAYHSWNLVGYLEPDDLPLHAAEHVTGPIDRLEQLEQPVVDQLALVHAALYAADPRELQLARRATRLAAAQCPRLSDCRRYLTACQHLVDQVRRDRIGAIGITKWIATGG